MTDYDDLLIIGGGPAGLSAAINAASEGIRTRLMDDAAIIGGQARESNAIENYPGFVDGVTGDVLTMSMSLQAHRFGVQYTCPVRAVGIERMGEYPEGFIHVTTDDYMEYRARTVLLALGLQYRRLQADGVSRLSGRGIFYGAPPTALPRGKCCIAVVGGANSAGQAVVKIAQNKKATVYLLVRKTLSEKMSQYLIDRIRSLDNVVIMEYCEVVRVEGYDHLKSIDYYCANDKSTTTLKMDYMFIFIGAMPRTLWLRGKLMLDGNNFVLTGGGVGDADNAPRRSMHYETSMLGVFAAGDVRAYSTKRISAAVGEGSAVVQQIHQYFAITNEVIDGAVNE